MREGGGQRSAAVVALMTVAMMKAETVAVRESMEAMAAANKMATAVVMAMAMGMATAITMVALRETALAMQQQQWWQQQRLP
jgi:hypothetical protein